MAEVTLPTQKFVEIEEIKNGVVRLKNRNLRQVLIVSGINFDLKSEEEQTIILNTFQRFLNTIDFPVQFFIHSRKMNVDDYLERMEGRKRDEENELLKIQIEVYITFIRSFIEDNAIISKTFFVVVPYETTRVTVQGSGGLFSFFKKSEAAQKKEVTIRPEDVEQLEHRVQEVTEGLSQIGLRVAPLGDDELTELFYNLYNPHLTDKKDLEITKTQ